MRITILCPGRLPNAAYAKVIEEYGRRLPKGIKLQWVEVKEEKLGKISEAEAKRNEGKRILEALPEVAEVIALDESGDMLDSKGFARLLGELRNRGVRFSLPVAHVVCGQWYTSKPTGSWLSPASPFSTICCACSWPNNSIGPSPSFPARLTINRAVPS